MKRKLKHIYIYRVEEHDIRDIEKQINRILNTISKIKSIEFLECGQVLVRHSAIREAEQVEI